MKDQKIKIDLGAVQETLMLPLLARAIECEKENPILYDSYARDIVTRIDYNFSKLRALLTDEMHQMSFPIRAYNFDNIIMDFLEQNRNAVVVNIGAGLDTTFQRVDNGNVLWVNIDLPDVAALRQKLIPDSEREMTIAKSVFDFTWMDDIEQQAANPRFQNDQNPNKFQILKAKLQTDKSCQGNKDGTGNIIIQQKKGRPILFMAAGVLCYFEAQQVKLLFRKIAEAYPSANVVFDSFPWFTAWAWNMGVRMGKAHLSAFMKWHLKGASRLKKWVDTIKVVEEYPMFAKVKFRDDWSKKVIRGMKVTNLLRLSNMVHVQF